MPSVLEPEAGAEPEPDERPLHRTARENPGADAAGPLAGEGEEVEGVGATKASSTRGRSSASVVEARMVRVASVRRGSGQGESRRVGRRGEPV